jgi:hypothetical protein
MPILSSNTPWNVPARLTVDGLRGALVELTRIGDINGRAGKIN